MRLALVLVVTLAGCASSPEYVARQSDWDVCRLTMGGPHSRAAEAEAARRGVDCRPLYPAIQGKMANENAATQNYLRSLQAPPPQIRGTNCQTVRIGNSLETQCN